MVKGSLIAIFKLLRLNTQYIAALDCLIKQSTFQKNTQLKS